MSWHVQLTRWLPSRSAGDHSIPERQLSARNAFLTAFVSSKDTDTGCQGSPAKRIVAAAHELCNSATQTGHSESRIPVIHKSFAGTNCPTSIIDMVELNTLIGSVVESSQRGNTQPILCRLVKQTVSNIPNTW